jgi:RNA recognition motif-containing protein
LYVKGLPTELDQGTLQQLFQAYGAIESCRIVRDVNTGVSKGFGFVKFSTVQNAEDAIREVNGSTIRDHILEVKFADVDAGPAPLGAQRLSRHHICFRSWPASTLAAKGCGRVIG